MTRRVLTVVCLFLVGCTSQFRSRSELPLSYRQAEDAFRLGQYERAEHGYRVFLQTGSHKELVPGAMYKMALAEFRLGAYDRCLKTLAEMERRYPKRDWPQIPALRGDVDEALGNMVSAVRWWEEAWRIAEGEQKIRLYNRIDQALSVMPQEALKGAVAAFTSEEMRSLANSRLRVPAKPRSTPVPAATTAVPSGAVSQGVPLAELRVACLLPVSGPYAAYGKGSLNGIRLALGSRAADLLVVDEGGGVEQAQAAVKELIANRRVVAVIGPLRSEVAEAVAPLAERAGLPMLLLSQREVLNGRYVLPLALTPSRQAARLVEYAMGAGLTRFGIVHPSDAYGTALADAFKAEVLRRGGRLSGMIAYARDAQEFAIEALTVQRWHEQEGVEVVFLPDFAATAVLLAHQLRTVVPDLVFLGSNGWNDDSALARGGSDVEGAVFVDGFFAGSERAATRAFVAAYRAEYGSAPGILEAQAYDAASLVRRALETGVQSRAQVIPRLRLIGVIEGAAGRIEFGPNGVDRQVFLLTLRGGTIQEVRAGRENQTAG